jgi:MerR family transcriptional regulator, light-induced transcriptional regulator
MDHTVGGDDIRLGDFGVIYHDLDLASAVVRTSLGNLRRGFGPTSSAPSLVVATPRAQMHELGALIVAMIAASDRWRVTYLGPSLPAEEIAGAAHQSQARAVALSLVYPGDDPFLRGQLVKLQRGLAEGVMLLVGGQSADAYRGVLKEIGAVWFEYLTAFRRQLEVLRLRKLDGPRVS